MDLRYIQLAKALTEFSIKVQPGHSILIDTFEIPQDMTVALIRAVRACGGIPFVNIHQAAITRELISEATEAQYMAMCGHELSRMQHMHGYIAVRGSHNIFEHSDVPSEKLNLVNKILKPVIDHRVNHTNWVVLRWPTPSMAQQARQSTQAFTDYFFKVCLLDYSRMEVGMAALQAAMRATDRVRIKSPLVDLTFSIQSIPAITCGGAFNIPDGEVFTAPVKESVEGYIQFNVPSVYQGTSFENVRFIFSKGKIVEATANDSQRLNEILDSDAGARYIGEFAIGFNPHILEPMRDILFDEKISGSFHFTPGQAYEDADNGNRSQVHWDLVSIQRPEYGGGEIWFDDVLIRKDGLFVPEALQTLNPDYLLATNKS